MEVNVHEAKTNFSKLLQRVALGEEITIAKAGVPVARVPIQGQGATRPLGLYRGQIHIPTDFDAPLPDNLMAGFLGKDQAGRKPVKPVAVRKRKKA